MAKKAQNAKIAEPVKMIKMAKVAENAKTVDWLSLWKSQLCQMGKMFRVVKLDKKADLTKNTKVG